MRYLTWRLKWDKGGSYGTGPESIIAINGGSLSASEWVDGSIEYGIILGYLSGAGDISKSSLTSLLADWSATEITESEALAFAKKLNADAFIFDGGIIIGVHNDPNESLPE